MWFAFITILLLLPVNESLVQEIRVHYNDDEYVMSDSKATYKETIRWCQDLNGTLPSVHSRNDIDFLISELVPQSASENGNIFLSRLDLSNGKWEDGTPYDYPFKVIRIQDCDASCCGPVLYEQSLSYRILNEVNLCNDVRRNGVCKLSKPKISNSSSKSFPSTLSFFLFVGLIYSMSYL